MAEIGSFSKGKTLLDFFSPIGKSKDARLEGWRNFLKNEAREWKILASLERSRVEILRDPPGNSQS